MISDYNTGIVNKKIVYHLIKKANEYKIPTIIDPKNYYEYYKNCFLIKPNKNDAEIISNIKNYILHIYPDPQTSAVDPEAHIWAKPS